MDAGPVGVHVKDVSHLFDLERFAARLVDKLARVEGHEWVALPYFPYRPHAWWQTNFYLVDHIALRIENGSAMASRSAVVDWERVIK
jgi:hypothetical protein